MSLVSCPECQREVSSIALACPQCAYPYPGKKGDSEENLQPCRECGGVISKKAQLCPHCGISCTDVTDGAPVNEEFKEESWLCTHCGTPYTRKARKPAESIVHADNQESDDQKPPVTQQEEMPKPTAHPSHTEKPQFDNQTSSFRREQEISFLEKMGSAAPAAGRHPAPLWIPSSQPQNLDSSPSPPRKKIAFIAAIVLLLLIGLATLLWFLWEPNGTNPFDFLTISSESMNNTPSSGPQSES